ncbi:hypothetical protein HBH52_073620 [Parastagonospora nodorum]|nr:hypothetical protein HBH52_073620 [Parastagonospora nodorum]KAH4943079.1 hypothetical protein HBH73_152920 [Parastagonospora nodorum]KAH5536209.1 hypothetical protein HBI27_161440 [Parastagonospora nodorum]
MAWGKREHGKHWKHWRDLGPSRSATVSGPFGKRLCKLGPARSEAPSGDQCDTIHNVNSFHYTKTGCINRSVYAAAICAHDQNRQALHTTCPLLSIEPRS